MKRTGVLFDWLETGMEGRTQLCFNDEAFNTVVSEAEATVWSPAGSIRWSYEGLIQLSAKYHARVYDKTGALVFDGVYPFSTSDLVDLIATRGNDEMVDLWYAWCRAGYRAELEEVCS